MKMKYKLEYEPKYNYVLYRWEEGFIFGRWKYLTTFSSLEDAEKALDKAKSFPKFYEV